MRRTCWLLCLALLLSGCNTMLQTGKPLSLLSRHVAEGLAPANKSKPAKIHAWSEESPRLPTGLQNRTADIERVHLAPDENLHVFDQLDLADVSDSTLPDILENPPTTAEVPFAQRSNIPQVERTSHASLPANPVQPGQANLEVQTDHQPAQAPVTVTVTDRVPAQPRSESSAILLQAAPAAGRTADYSHSPSMQLLHQQERQAPRLEVQSVEDLFDHPADQENSRRTPAADNPANKTSAYRPHSETIYFVPVPENQPSLDDDSSLMMAGWNADLKEVSLNQLLPPDLGQADASDQDWRTLLDRTIEALEIQETGFDHSRPVRREKLASRIRAAIQSRLLKLSAGDTEGALKPIEGLSQNEQAFWHHQFVAVSSFLNNHVTRIGDATLHPDAAQETLESIRRAQFELAQLAPLQIKKVELCSQVSGFGQYEILPPDFEPLGQAIVYCEVRNFSAIPVETSGQERRYSSRLRGAYQILDENNEIVGQRQFETTEDLSRNARTDFYMYFPLTLPELPDGTYQLHVSIEDVHANKRAERTFTKKLTIGGGSKVKTAREESPFRR